MPVDPDRVVITSGTSEGIELTLTALAEAGDEVLIPSPTYPLYTAVLAKIGAKAVFYRKDPANGWLPDVQRDRAAHHARDARARRDRSEQSDRRHVSRQRAARADRARRQAQHSAAGRRGLRRPRLRRSGRRRWRASIRTRRSFRSRRCRRRTSRPDGAPAGWRSGGPTALDDVLAGVKKLADGRLCSTGPMEYAIPAALNGDRSHEASFRAALRERADLTVSRLNAIPGMHTVAPTAAFYAMPQVVAAAGRHRRGLRARAAARDRRAVRLRLRLRHEARGRILPRRLPRRVRPSSRTSTTWSPTSRRTSSRAAERDHAPSRRIAGADPLRHRDDGARGRRALVRLHRPRRAADRLRQRRCSPSASARSSA